MEDFKVLISDPLPGKARAILEETGKVEVFEGQEDMERLIPEIDGWIVRSGTKITADYLERATRLKCVCRAGAGIDNIDLDAATRHGIVVMNTPGSNSMAAAEQTIALMLALARNIPFAHATMMAGGWGRKSYVGIEVEGKTLSVVGLGKVGRIVARKARGLGMKVIGHDPYVSPDIAGEMGLDLVSLDEAFAAADFLALHVPLADATRGLLNRESLARCKEGVRIINCARGGVVDEEALVEAVNSGHVAGAAVDVFATEPPPEDSPLRNHPKIVTTPHLGASTREAQEQVDVASGRQVCDYLLSGIVSSSVNAVSVAGEDRERFGPFARLAQVLGAFQAQVLAEQPKAIRIEVEAQEGGELLERLVVDHALVGFIGHTADQPVNVVNARLLARERGMDVTVKSRVRPGTFTRALRIDVTANGDKRRTEGAVVGRDSLRLVRFDDYIIDGFLGGSLIITMSDDRPGMVGRLGTIIGDSGLNIANLSLGRTEEGGNAMAIFNLDSPAPPDAIEKLRACEGVTQAIAVEIG